MLHRIRLARAYRRVFATDDGQIVLRDLARHSGFYRITSPGSAEVIAYNEGMRATFWRIFGFLRLTGQDMAKLAKEAREQSVSTDDDGEFEE